MVYINAPTNGTEILSFTYFAVNNSKQAEMKAAKNVTIINKGISISFAIKKIVIGAEKLGFKE